MASCIAAKSPVAVRGTKANMEYALNHTTEESLEYVQTWNMSMLMTEDLMKGAMAQLDPDGEKPTFSKL
jgi:delta(3,5)-delta(2,4)-dienoyl-CoA isomerase